MLLAGNLVFLGCKKNDDDPAAETQTFEVTVQNVSADNNYFQSGVFNTPVGATMPAAANPGESYEFEFNAGPGHKLSFATMYVQSNDLFYSPAGAGIELYNSGVAVTGDITSQIMLWDAGTEVNEDPGSGPNQPPRQTGANTGPDENGMVTEISMVSDGFTYPAVSSNIRVTLTSTGDNAFMLRIENLSGSTTPIAPGVFAVHSANDPLFTAGMADQGNGLEALAEDGSPDDLLAWLTNSTGYTSPFAPGLWTLHTAGNPVFMSNEADRGEGLEALAEDGDPSGLMSALANNSIVSNTGVFDTPTGASAAGPIGPTDTYKFTFTATKGEYLSFATMLIQSNDLFIGTAGTGMALWSGDNPISGEITSSLKIWDAGTEVNQFPGAGDNQAPRQSAANTGTDESVSVMDIGSVNDGFTYPSVSDLLKVTIALK